MQSDEDIAKLLQAQFDAERTGPAAAAATAATAAAGTHIAPSTAAVPQEQPQPEKPNAGPFTDEELAKKVQEELNKGLPKINTLDMLLAETLKQQFAAEDAAEAAAAASAAAATAASHAPSFFESPYDAEFRRMAQIPPTPGCIKRIRSDLEAFIKHPNPTIFIAPHEEDVTHIEALIIGPEDTPYEGGFFHFDMRFPHDYPWKPPKVILRTTDGGQTRFNPNLYADGKVCLSILGTWQGPSWKPVQTMETVLVSIQSLMNPMPYHNEPGYETERGHGESKTYNEIITHETLRVAVAGMMESPTCGDVFKPVMDEIFVRRYERYLRIAQDNLRLEGKGMVDPFGHSYASGRFQFRSILQSLERIYARLAAPPSS